MGSAIKYLLLSGLLFTSVNGQVERRAAFDIGSSTVKVEVADVDQGQVVDLLYSNKISVPLRASLTASNQIEPAIEQQLRDALERHVEAAHRLGTDAICGIATAASREATNGPEVLKRLSAELGISLHIISQEEEGRLGYRSAVAVSGIDDAVVWDSGGGSFQLTRQTNEGVKVYHGPIGRIAALDSLHPLTEGRPTVTPAEIEKLSDLLKQKITELRPDWLDRHVVAIASICEVAADHLGATYFTTEEVEALMMRMGDRPDVLYRLCLVYAVMDRLGIEEAAVYPANGSCRGLLTDKRYWVP